MLVPLLLLSLVAAAPTPRSPAPFTVPIHPVSKAGPTPQQYKGIVAFEQSRAAQIKAAVAPSSAASAKTIPAINWQYVQYTALIGVGSPPTTYNLVIDTGSSNTFVGTGIPYQRTPTSVATGEAVYVEYGTGYFSGYEYLDLVTIGPGFAITDQSIGDALQDADFPGVDGIIGVGPTILTQGTLTSEPNALIPTVMDNALAQGLIPEEILGIQFAPTLTNDSVNGAMTFGGVESRYAEAITYVPVTATQPSSYYWGINVTSLDYGTSANLFKNDAGIVDTGTTLIYIADDFFAKYQAAIPGSYMDNEYTGMLVIPASEVGRMQDLNFLIGGKTFTLTPNAQLVPQAEVEAYGGFPGTYYSYIGPLGSPSGEGLDFIIGQKYLERFYSVFDTKNNRVGFAYTDYTTSTM